MGLKLKGFHKVRGFVLRFSTGLKGKVHIYIYILRVSMYADSAWG